MTTHDDDERPPTDIDEIRASLSTRRLTGDDVRAALGIVESRRGWYLWRDTRPHHTNTAGDERPADAP